MSQYENGQGCPVEDCTGVLIIEPAQYQSIGEIGGRRAWVFRDKVKCNQGTCDFFTHQDRPAERPFDDLPPAPRLSMDDGGEIGS